MINTKLLFFCNKRTACIIYMLKCQNKDRPHSIVYVLGLCRELCNSSFVSFVEHACIVFHCVNLFYLIGELCVGGIYYINK